MSSFFTAPASQRKRKRTSAAAPDRPKTQRRRREDSISSEDSDQGDHPDNDDHGDTDDTASDAADETAAERRLRLAERYLDNIREEVDEAGFDAAEIDRDLIAERLKEDVAEAKGRLYRRIASSLDFSAAEHTLFRADNQATTAAATCPPYAYTATKDMALIKWSIPTPPDSTANLPTSLTPRRRPTQLVYTKGNKNRANDPTFHHHTAPILCIAASGDGKFVATGGADRKLIIWRAGDLTPLKVFTQHRDAVISLAFRRGTNQLFSASKDRTIKTWSLDELAYVETLFGHQDAVIDIAALAQERCVSVGARDRTARLWKVVEESQLVFRGGGTSVTRTNRSGGSTSKAGGGYAEGSIDRIALVDEETFVTGSDNGSISLWSINKKKPVFTLPLAHGLDPPMRPDEVHADAKLEGEDVWIPPQQPRWITALITIPYTDVILSGSWDGWVRAWRVSEDGKRIEPLGAVGQTSPGEGGDGPMSDSVTATQESGTAKVRGVVNDLSVFERGDRGRDGICVVAAVGKEARLGRWRKFAGKNAAVVMEVQRNGAAGEETGVAE